jgi:hypothetical protein
MSNSKGTYVLDAVKIKAFLHARALERGGCRVDQTIFVQYNANLPIIA